MIIANNRFSDSPFSPGSAAGSRNYGLMTPDRYVPGGDVNSMFYGWDTVVSDVIGAITGSSASTKNDAAAQAQLIAAQAAARQASYTPYYILGGVAAAGMIALAIVKSKKRAPALSGYRRSRRSRRS